MSDIFDKAILNETMQEPKFLAVDTKAGNVQTFYNDKILKVQPSFYSAQEIAKKEDEFGKTGGKGFRPFPLETIHEPIVEAFVALSQAEKLIKTCLENNASVYEDESKKSQLRQILHKLYDLRQEVKGVSIELDKIFFN